MMHMNMETSICSLVSSEEGMENAQKRPPFFLCSNLWLHILADLLVDFIVLVQWFSNFLKS